MTIDVNAVNDAPLHSVPGTQVTRINTPLVFSWQGNLISITDVDADSAEIEVTLTVTHGILSLGYSGYITFASGSSNNSATMTFTGTVSGINMALDAMFFTATTDYRGMASLRILTSDLGNTGAGGTLTDDDSVTLVVNGATISGHIWKDDDQDGIQDESEDSLYYLQVELLAYVNDASTVVDWSSKHRSGSYLFDALAV